MTLTVGIDIGSGAVKTVLFSDEEWIAKRVERIRRRDPMELARQGFEEVLHEASVGEKDISYTATTGEGENVKYATGHFYSMTTHARGGIFLNPQARAVVDIGALNGRAIYINERGKVLSYKMTSQCASGSGQFLENIARYLGVAVEEIGPLSRTSKNPEKVSSICAVLAETDVINMVSRAIPTQDILKGNDPPELIVIDWVLPGMSGLEYVRQLKADPTYATTRILVVSIRQERQDVREMIAAGADDYIFKPVDARTLENRLPVLGF